MTDEADANRFAGMVREFSEEDYDIWLENDATDRQKALAETIREPIPPEEIDEEIQEAEQEVTAQEMRLSRLERLRRFFRFGRR